jgi:hypothetical protein
MAARNGGQPHPHSQATPQNRCVDFSFGKTKFVPRSFQGVPPNRPAPRARELLETPYGAKNLENDTLDLHLLQALEIPQNRQSFLWKCLEKTSGNLEKLAKSLEAARPGRADP